MADDDLRTWISDNAIKILGISERTIVDYMIAAARKSKSSAALLRHLHEDAQLPQTQDAVAFAKGLFEKVPRASAAPTTKAQAKAKEKETIQLLRKNNQFTLLLDDDDDDDEQRHRKSYSTNDKASKKSKKEKKIRVKDSDASQWQSDAPSNDEGSTGLNTKEEKSWKRKSNQKQNQDSDIHQPEESERERDLRERDEFAQRLKERDSDKTVKVYSFSIPSTDMHYPELNQLSFFGYNYRLWKTSRLGLLMNRLLDARILLMISSLVRSTCQTFVNALDTNIWASVKNSVWSCCNDAFKMKSFCSTMRN